MYSGKPEFRPRRNNDELLSLFQKPEPFEVEARPLTTNYIVSVDDSFESVRQFEQIVSVLENARPGDMMEIKLSSPGGALHAILPLLAAMKTTHADVFIHAVSDVASAGTFLLMQADGVLLNEYVTVMFHQVSFGSGGPGSSVESHVNHTVKSSKQIIQDMYQDFFTNEEIEAMLAGKDFWMGKEEFDQRYEKRAKLMAQRRIDEESKLTAPVKKPRKKKTAELVV